MRRLVYGLLTATVVCALLMHNLPYLIRDQLVLWFYQQDVEHASLKSLSVNWLKGQVEVDQLLLKREGYPAISLQTLVLDVDLAALMDNRIHLQSIIVEGLTGGVKAESDQLWVGPLLVPAANPSDNNQVDSEATEAWVFGLDQLTLVNVDWLSQWQGSEYRLEIEQLSLKQLLQWQPSTQTMLKAKGAINGAAFNLDSQSRLFQPQVESTLALKIDALPLRPFTSPFAVPLSGSLTLDMQVKLHGEQSIESSGLVQLDSMQYQTPQLSTKLNRLSWQGLQQWTIDNGKLSKGSLDGEFSLQKVDIKQGNVTAGVERINWQGSMSVGLEDRQLSQLTSRHQLKVDALTAHLQSLDVTFDQLAFKDLKATMVQGQPWNVMLDEFQVERFDAQQQDYSLLGFESLSVQHATSDTLSAQIDTVALAGLSIAQSDEMPLSSWQDIAAKKIAWQPEKLSVDSITLSGGQSLLHINQQGKLSDVNLFKDQIERLFVTSREKEAEPADAMPANTPAMVIELTKVQLLEAHNVMIKDQSVSPTFTLPVEIHSLNAGPYNTETKQETALSLQAKLSKFGQLSVDAGLNMAGDNDTGHWLASIKNLELPYSSPYSLKYTGYFIESGQLGFESEGSINKGVLEGKNKLGLFNFDVEARQADQVEKFSQQLSMPLETAIMVLEDDDQNIELELPVTGSLQDPSFGLQNVVGMLAGKGLKAAAFSYLTKALQPYATLISIATTVIEADQKGTFITLSPVTFEPGKAVLSSDSQGYLTKLSNMMTERPAMRMKLCGQAVAVDQRPLKRVLAQENKKRKKPLTAKQLENKLAQRLQSLAERRAEEVKSVLLSAIAAERLFLCYPKVDLAKGEKSQPRVELGL